MRNVIPIFDPHRARKAELRHWFNGQAQHPAGHVAAVTIGLTADGMLTTSGCGIDQASVAALMAGLNAAMARLQEIAIDAEHVPVSGRTGKNVHQLPDRNRSALPVVLTGTQRNTPKRQHVK